MYIGFRVGAKLIKSGSCKFADKRVMENRLVFSRV